MTRLPVAALLALACASARAHDTQPARVTFDATLLHNARGRDVSAFEGGAQRLAGTQWLDIWRNGVFVGRRPVQFDGTPCFDAGFVDWLGVDRARLSVAQREALAIDACTAIAVVHPAAVAEHERGELALRVSIPQALLTRNATVDATPYDAGLTALRIGYGAHAVRHENDAGQAQHHAGLRLDVGANAGAWRLRHRSTHAWAPARARDSTSLDTLLERDVLRFDARLTLGDFHAGGLLFDPMPLRGVRFQSDERMVPAWQLQPAPVIRGVADTNARVQVRQHGRLVHEALVAPGPFALDDVQAPGRGGDLDVRVIEADGRVRAFVVPHATIPGLLRAGRMRFGLAAGVSRHAFASRAPVVMGAVERAASDRLTVRAAAQATARYAHAIAGAAFATPIGALSLDRSHARWSAPGGLSRGAATRAAFSTTWSPTGTTLQLGAWHRPARGFHALEDVALRRVAAPSRRERHRFDASLHHAFGARRQGVRVALLDRRYHDTPAPTRSLQVAWSLPVGRNNAMLQALVEQAWNTPGLPNRHATLALTVPLHIGSAPVFAHAHAGVRGGRVALNAGAGGDLDARHAWYVGLAQGDAARSASRTLNASLVHNGRAGRIDAGFSASHATRQWSVAGEGSVVVHPFGVTFGPTLGDTVALVRAEYGAGAQVLMAPHVRLDRRGRALVPQLSPYRRNRVGIDAQGLPPGTSFEWTERDVFPRAGAVVDVSIPGARAATRFQRIVDDTGTPAPFGASLIDASGARRALVGRDGLARVPIDAPALHLEALTHPCTPARESADAIPTTTCASIR